MPNGRPDRHTVLRKTERRCALPGNMKARGEDSSLTTLQDKARACEHTRRREGGHALKPPWKSVDVNTEGPGGGRACGVFLPRLRLACKFYFQMKSEGQTNPSKWLAGVSPRPWHCPSLRHGPGMGQPCRTVLGRTEPAAWSMEACGQPAGTHLFSCS